jgi:hypothetical protein
MITITKEVEIEIDDDDIEEYLNDLDSSDAIDLAKRLLNDNGQAVDDASDLVLEMTTDFDSDDTRGLIVKLTEHQNDIDFTRTMFEYFMEKLQEQCQALLSKSRPVALITPPPVPQSAPQTDSYSDTITG